MQFLFSETVGKWCNFWTPSNLKTFFFCLHWQQARPPGVNPQIRDPTPQSQTGGSLSTSGKSPLLKAGVSVCLPPSINNVYAHSPLLMVSPVGTGAFHLHSAVAQNLAPSDVPAPRRLPAPSTDTTSCSIDSTSWSIDEGCSFLLLHFQVPIKPPHHLSLLSVWISASQTAQLLNILLKRPRSPDPRIRVMLRSIISDFLCESTLCPTPRAPAHLDPGHTPPLWWQRGPRCWALGSSDVRASTYGRQGSSCVKKIEQYDLTVLPHKHQFYSK